ncbi:MAG TPA: alpha-L-rhamnosidase C-terminal domain-containing protein [Dictyobacter sp.]|jgi:alpha-L-rhamnosidase|nr:alpha-L-rhamnosidase C-terminal domain-containing protein [Dictyobacter sp.]
MSRTISDHFQPRKQFIIGAHYRTLAEHVRTAFATEYITPAGRILSDSPTAYALALQFNLFTTEEQRQHAGEKLVALVHKSGYHINTGFVGTPLICDALCSLGRNDIAYRLLLQHECPSWLYPVTMGATTIWERWDSLRPDGSINPGQMTSFNHYALGTVADWLHRFVAGLSPVAPGYRHMVIQPHPGGSLTHAHARHQTPYGSAESGWNIEQGHITIEVRIPPNTTAQVIFPGNDNQPPVDIRSGTHRWSYPYRDTIAHSSLSLESTIDELIDDPVAWEAVKELLHEKIPTLAPMLIRQMQTYGNVIIRQALSIIPYSDPIVTTIETTFNELRHPSTKEQN